MTIQYENLQTVSAHFIVSVNSQLELEIYTLCNWVLLQMPATNTFLKWWEVIALLFCKFIAFSVNNGKTAFLHHYTISKKIWLSNYPIDFLTSVFFNIPIAFTFHDTILTDTLMFLTNVKYLILYNLAKTGVKITNPNNFFLNISASNSTTGCSLCTFLTWFKYLNAS